MKGRTNHPNIILRFSKTVASSTPPPPPPNSPPPPTTTESDDDTTSSARNLRPSNYDGEQAMSRPGKRKSATQDVNPAGDATVSDRSSVSPPVYSSKRKRGFVQSIGGGKGDLQPPPPRARRPRNSTGNNATTTTTATTTTNNNNSNNNISTSPNAASPSSEDGGSGSGKKDEEKRVLRSQDTNKKSEFEEWFETTELSDDIQMPIDTKSATSINGLTRDDDDDNTPPPALLSSPQKPLLPKPVEDPEIVRIRSLPIETIDLEEELQRSDSRHHRYHTDPLADGVYVPAHLTAERLETRGKNIERDLLAHNSHRIRGDLEKLNSPDWIKAIGLSPALVASCSKKELEQRKVPLIAHLESTLEKYNAWSKDLKRKKNGRTSTSPKESQERDGSQETEEGAELGSQDESDNEHHRSGSRRRTSTKRSRPSSMSASISKLTQKKPARLEVEFTSFYDKPYMREQALSKWRKSSRTQTAFGQPLPVIAEKEFELPEELFASAAAARQSRARKRLSR